jgi:hypothetical protein
MTPPPLPSFVLACPATLALIVRAIAGELSRASFDRAWDGLGTKGAEDYCPSEETQNWIREHWSKLMPGDEGKALLPGSEQAVAEVNPATPTNTPAREVWEDWMPIFFATFVATGGNITKAAKAAGKSRDTFYEHRDRNPLFFAAYKAAKEEADDRLREALDDRGVVGWEEPVYGRVGKDQDGQIGTVRKFDSQVLRLLASVHLPEVRAAKEAAGATTVNVSASASASAHAVAATPAKLKGLQERKRKLLEKAARRSLIDKHGMESQP